jgi:hypothetical protein
MAFRIRIPETPAGEGPGGDWVHRMAIGNRSVATSRARAVLSGNNGELASRQRSAEPGRTEPRSDTSGAARGRSLPDAGQGTTDTPVRAASSAVKAVGVDCVEVACSAVFRHY